MTTTKKPLWERAREFVLDFHSDAKPDGRADDFGTVWWTIKANGVTVSPDETLTIGGAWKRAARVLADGDHDA